MEGYFCMDAVTCKIKLSMRIFFKCYGTKIQHNLVLQKHSSVSIKVLLSLNYFFQEHSVVWLHKSKNHNVKLINTVKLK